MNKTNAKMVKAGRLISNYYTGSNRQKFNTAIAILRNSQAYKLESQKKIKPRFRIKS